MLKQNLTDQEILELISVPKKAHNWSGLKPRANHVGHLIGSCQITDHSGIFIPGVTIAVEIKAPIITDQCLFLFSIMKLVGREKRRIYQLEVCPRDKRSHNGDPVIFGPHEHIGAIETIPISEVGVSCGQWETSVSWFMQRIKIDEFYIELP